MTGGDAHVGDVLVVGESLIDVVTDASGRTVEVVGGSPANVALGLARQDVPVRLLTALARDTYGERIATHLATSGVVIDDASWSLSSTSTARAQITADGSAVYSFDIHWILPIPMDPAATRLIHIGSVGAFLEPGATDLEKWLGQRVCGTLVTFDPNIRPALLDDHAAAVARFERLAALADVVKLSDEDAEWLYPTMPPARVAQTILGMGPRLVALTRGAAGAVLQARGVLIEVTAPRVPVCDTVGAGDSFMAALIHEVLTVPGLLEAPTALGLLSTGTYAATAAGLTVQRVGADLPTAAEVCAAMT